MAQIRGARGPDAGRFHLQHGGEPAGRPAGAHLWKPSGVSVSGRSSGHGLRLTVAAASVPLAHLTGSVPRRHVLTGVLTALVLSSVVAALATSYWLLLAARLLTALAQALFWAVMAPVAVGLFAPEVRGRVVGALSVRAAGRRGGHLGAQLAVITGRDGLYGAVVGRACGTELQFDRLAGVPVILEVLPVRSAQLAGDGEPGALGDGLRCGVRGELGRSLDVVTGDVVGDPVVTVVGRCPADRIRAAPP
ncbi:hypothetical protein RKD49_000218 [Streptomyces glaucescens]